MREETKNHRVFPRGCGDGEGTANAPYRTARAFMVERYGEPLYRVPVDLGLGCPHRNPDGTGGCAFCPPDGGRAVQLADATTVREQVDRAVSFARRRYGARRFQAYIQAHTGTFAPASRQRRRVSEVLESYPFDALSIGTRPDCLSAEVLDVLEAFQQKIETWVELGVQTVHDATLLRIHRGHDWAAAREAILRLRERGLRVVAHGIIGLPGETRRHFIRTARTLASLPIDAIKIHNLHVLRNTELARRYAENPFPVYDAMAYGEELMAFLRHLPPNLPVLRVCTDSPPARLIAPRPPMQKGRFLRYIETQMILREWRQGDLFPGASPGSAPRDSGLNTEPVMTADGSITCRSPVFGEHFHSRFGARAEARHRYVHPARLAERLAASPVRLLDVGFGLGYNSLAAVQTRSAGSRELRITALEMDRRMIAWAAENTAPPEFGPAGWKRHLRELHDDGRTSGDGFRIVLRLGDARYTLPAEGLYDVIFLDAFSPPRNSELWTRDFFERLAPRLAGDGMLCTYCKSVPVLSGMLKAGLRVGTLAPDCVWTGTLAAHRAELLDNPLDARTLEAIHNTPRGIPFRDPTRFATNAEIIQHRQEAMRKP